MKAAIDQLLGNKPVKGLDFENVAFTIKLCPTDNQNSGIEFPDKAMRALLTKQGTKDFFLAGFSNDRGGSNCRFNFIANNGQRTEQKSDFPMQDFMMPETCKQTRKVEVYCYGTNHVYGFKFFDINNTLLFDVGDAVN